MIQIIAERRKCTNSAECYMKEICIRYTSPAHDTQQMWQSFEPYSGEQCPGYITDSEALIKHFGKGK